MSALSIYLHGVGVLGSGLQDWEHTRRVLRGEASVGELTMPRLAPAILPPAERRRASAAVRTALSVAQQAIEHAGLPASEVATVFATSDCDAENLHYMCETLASDGRDVSPTRFHNSVQNAPAGYWTIATACTAASNTVNSYDTVIAHALLEAVVQAKVESRPVMLVAHDLPMPEPLYALRPIDSGFAVALVFAPDRSDVELSVRFEVRTEGPPSSFADPVLEQLHRNVPSAQALPLLQCLATGSTEPVHLDYGGGGWLDVAVRTTG